MKQINVHCNFINNYIPFEDYCLRKMLFHHSTLIEDVSNTETIYEYKTIKFKVKWGRNIIPDDDSINILPFFYKNIDDFDKIHDYTNTTWIPLVITGEKIHKIQNEPFLSSHIQFENHLHNLKKIKTYSDNITLNENTIFKNEFLLSNTYFGWMHKLNMLLIYEFKNIYKRLNFNHKISYFIYRRSAFRFELANLLNKNKDIFVSQYIDPNITQYEPMEGITQNKIHSDNDFYDLLNTKFFITNNVYWSNILDMYFRGLVESEMYIIDETYSEFENDFSIINLSEKTYIPLLSGIPFLATHTYPLDCISKMLNVELHPFYNEIKIAQGNPQKINDFISSFLENYDDNLHKCKVYSEMIHTKYVDIVSSKNSLLEIILK